MVILVLLSYSNVLLRHKEDPNQVFSF